MTVSGKKYVVFGASGGCGKHVVRCLLEGGASVRAFVRTPESMTDLAHENLEVVKGDLADAPAVKAAIKGTDGVISLAGGAQKRAFHGGFLLPVVKSFHDGCLEHGVKRLVVQTGALVIAPTSMMANEETSNSFLKSYILRRIVGPYFSVFHGCHVDNDAVTEYFSGLDDAANEQLNWTLTRPTEITEGATKGKLISAENLRLPSENGTSFCDVGTYYVDLMGEQDPKWFHSSPFVRYERPDKSDLPASSSN
jgi:hypothetical protein